MQTTHAYQMKKLLIILPKYLVQRIGWQVAHQATEDEGLDAREYFIDFRQG